MAIRRNLKLGYCLVANDKNNNKPSNLLKDKGNLLVRVTAQSGGSSSFRQCLDQGLKSCVQDSVSFSPFLSSAGLCSWLSCLTLSLTPSVLGGVQCPKRVPVQWGERPEHMVFRQSPEVSSDQTGLCHMSTLSQSLTGRLDIGVPVSLGPTAELDVGVNTTQRTLLTWGRKSLPKGNLPNCFSKEEN